MELIGIVNHSGQIPTKIVEDVTLGEVAACLDQRIVTTRIVAAARIEDSFLVMAARSVTS